MFVFWAVVSATTLLVCAALVRAAFRGPAAAANDTPPDMQVYRDQLREIDRDLARGVIAAEEAERTRVEVKRRALEADRTHQQTGDSALRAPRTLTLAAAGLTFAVLVGLSFGLYRQLGAPGYADLPLQTRIAASDTMRAGRMGQTAAEARLDGQLPKPDVSAEAEQLIAQLREVVAGRPGDTEGLALLAHYEAQIGNFQAAYAAQQKLIALKGDAVQAGDLAELADLMILATNGYVSPEAEAVLHRILEMERQNGTARYYLGLLYAQTDRPDIAYRIWRGLLTDSLPGAPWVPVITSELPVLAEMAGIRHSPPQTPAVQAPGPSAEDIAAAADMSEADRAAMIRGMVDGLAERLATEGGPPEDWARLITSLAALGDTARAEAIFAESLQVFAASPPALSTLNAAAARAGLAP